MIKLVFLPSFKKYLNIWLTLCQSIVHLGLNKLANITTLVKLKLQWIKIKISKRET